MAADNWLSGGVDFVVGFPRPTTNERTMNDSHFSLFFYTTSQTVEFQSTVPNAIAICDYRSSRTYPFLGALKSRIFPEVAGHLRDHEFANRNPIRTRRDPRQGGQMRRGPPRPRRTVTERVFREWTRPFVKDLPTTTVLPKKECLFQLGSPFKALAH